MATQHGWPMVKLGDVAEIRSRLIQPEAIEGDTIYLGLEDLEKGGGIKSCPTALTSHIKSAKRVFGEKDILFGRLRPNLQKVALPGFSGVCTTDILTIRPSKMIDRHYLYAYLLTPQVLDYVSTRTTGINLPRISPAQLLELAVPLPPLDEQRRIAGILDQVRQLREKLDKTLSVFDELIQARFRQLFPFNDKDRELVELGSIASLEGGRSIVGSPSESDARFKVLKISAVTSGLFHADENKDLPLDYIPPSGHLVAPGDLLISRANTAELVGATAIVPEDAPLNLALPDKIWRFKWVNSDASPMFYRTLLQLPEMRIEISKLCSGTGGSMKNIPKSKLLKLPIPKVDPVEQARFSSEVQAFDSTRRKVKTQRNQLERLNTALQTRAFQGTL